MFNEILTLICKNVAEVVSKVVRAEEIKAGFQELPRKLRVPLETRLPTGITICCRLMFGLFMNAPRAFWGVEGRRKASTRNPCGRVRSRGGPETDQRPDGPLSLSLQD